MCEWIVNEDGTITTGCCVLLMSIPERIEEYECCPFCGAEIEIEDQ